MITEASSKRGECRPEHDAALKGLACIYIGVYSGLPLDMAELAIHRRLEEAPSVVYKMMAAQG